MTYVIQYSLKVAGRGNFRITIRRYIIKRGDEWQLQDGNEKNIRPFQTLADAPTEGRALFAASGVACCLKWPALRRNSLLSGG